MTISRADGQMVWARAGWRCSMDGCGVELITAGDPSIIGEIAHIVGQSQTGPRGQHPMPLADRDRFPNLMLMCPTHHTMIDKDEAAWPVDVLVDMKTRHESAIAKRLAAGNIQHRVSKSDAFLESRLAHWKKIAGAEVWLAASLTPLDVAGEILDPMNPTIRAPFSAIRTTRGTYQTNRHDPEPSADGFRLEKRAIQGEDSYVMEVFRNGHAEFLFSMERGITRNAELTEPWEGQSIKHNILRWANLAAGLSGAVWKLFEFWNAGLPYHDAILTVRLLNPEGMSLIVADRSGFGDHLISKAQRSDVVEFSTVCDSSMNADDVLGLATRRLVNAFGLDLPSMFSGDAKLLDPSHFRG